MDGLSPLVERDIGNGHIVVVCQSHQLESCRECCYDFSDLNKMAREQKRMDDAEDQPMRRGLLPRGTAIRLNDRMGNKPPKDLVAQVCGTQADPDGEGGAFGACRGLGLHDKLMSYVLLDTNTGEKFRTEVSDVHQRWQLEGVSLDDARRLVKKIDGKGRK